MDPDDPTPATGKLRLYDMAVYPSRWDGGMHIDMEAKFPEGATVKFYWAPANAEAPKGLTLEPVLWCQAGERSTPWLDGNPNLRELGCGDTEATPPVSGSTRSAHSTRSTVRWPRRTTRQCWQHTSRWPRPSTRGSANKPNASRPPITVSPSQVPRVGLAVCLL
ncbi:hypothetical protein AHiyo6_15090 [Arthrobacter sp. Hiyo6]|nr:hypothetical protein AHiyo6_15090 [Arthrobacter sp. Hiyo6]